MSVYQNINGTLYRMDASDLVQLAAVDTEGILGGAPGATTNGQTLVDQLAADDVQAQTDIGQIKTDLSDLDDEKLDIADEQVLGAWNLAKITVSTQTINGATFTVNADKSITVTKSSAGANDATLYTSDIFDVEAGRTYYLSGCPAGGAASGSYRIIYQEYDGTTWKSNNNDIGNGLTITTSYRKARLCIEIAKTYIISGSLKFNIMLALKPNMPYVAPAMTNRELTAFNSGYNFIKFLYAANGSAIYSGDLNDLHAGYVYFSTSASNIPVSAYGYCLTLERPTDYNYAVQIAVTVTLSNLQLFIRQKRDHTWESWKTVTLT